MIGSESSRRKSEKWIKRDEKNDDGWWDGRMIYQIIKSWNNTIQNRYI